MNRRPICLAAAVTVAACLLAPDIADAHHNTVSCQSPGIWLIVNSEARKSETFTTDQGHTGSIPPGGSVTVQFSGTSLTVYGRWTTGETNTASGTGNCTVTTTTEASTTSVPTTVQATTTVPPPSTSTVASTTTAPVTTPPTTSPSTTVPGSTSSTLPSSTTSSPSPTTAPPPPSSVPSGPSSTTPAPPAAPPVQRLPATR